MKSKILTFLTMLAMCVLMLGSVNVFANGVDGTSVVGGNSNTDAQIVEWWKYARDDNPDSETVSLYMDGVNIRFNLKGLSLVAPDNWDDMTTGERIALCAYFYPFYEYIDEHCPAFEDGSGNMDLKKRSDVDAILNQPYYKVLETMTGKPYEELSELTQTAPDPEVISLLHISSNDTEEIQGYFSDGLGAVLTTIGTYLVNILPIALVIMGILVALVFAVRFFRSMSR